MNSIAASSSNPCMVPTEVVSQMDRRQSTRTYCRTVVTTVAVPEESPETPASVIKTHSEDISAGGAKLVSPEPLPSMRFFLRFLLPTHWDRFLEAEVVSESIREQVSFTKRIVREYVYRVRFTGFECQVDGVDRANPDAPSSELDDQESDRA